MCQQSAERTMHKRPAALTLSAPGQLSRGPQLSLPRAPHVPARSSLPEIFTFDVEALPTASTDKPPRRSHTKRARKVLYQFQTRNRYMPPEERNPALRWLYVLCLVVFVQVCLEEGNEAAFSLQGPAPRQQQGLASALQGPASSLQGQQREGPAAAMKELLQGAVSMPEPSSVLLASPSVLHEAPTLHQTLQEQASQPLNLTCRPLERMLLTF
ncbi:uncharacterized protein LOC144753082 [Lissotriton helveticus]